MQNSNAVVKKIYCVVINGEVQEKLDFDSMEIAKDYIKLFSLKYRQENTIAVGFMTVLKLVIKVLLIGLIQFLQRKKNVIKDIG